MVSSLFDLSLPAEEGTRFYSFTSLDTKRTLDTAPKSFNCRMCYHRAERTYVADEPNTTWIYCNRCKTPTRHILVASHSYNSSPLDEEGSLASDSWGEYRLWACAGCDT